MTGSMGAEKLLIVDDDPGILRGLKWSLDSYAVLTAESRQEALQAFDEHRPKVVTLDLGLPPSPDDAEEGLAVLDAIVAQAPETKVIVVSGNDDRKNAVAAIARGAWDFCAKPIDETTLHLIIDRAYHVYALEAENRRLRAEEASALHGIVTGSSAMAQVCRTIEKVAPADISVLLLGESGTGKEVLARALHRLSGRRDGEFVAINCAAIPDALLESELFGYEKGAFTGAVKQTEGKVERADGGTLFLDEIGDMPMALQAKLLRFLQERQFERLGGRKPISVDVRVICATHRDLSAMIKENSFREDLFYRVSELSIQIPALRERGDDPILLAKHFVERFAFEQKRPAPRLGKNATAAIQGHAWRGNVREMENRIRRAVILCEGAEICASDLDLETLEVADEASVVTLREARERAESDVVERALERCGGNLSAAARLLDVSRPTLYSLMRQHHLGPNAET